MGKRPRALTALEKKWLDRHKIARRLFHEMRHDKRYQDYFDSSPRARLIFKLKASSENELITLDGTHASKSFWNPLCEEGIKSLKGVEGPAVSPQAFYPDRKPKLYVAFVAPNDTMLSVVGLLRDVGEVYVLSLAEELLLLTKGESLGLLVRSENKFAPDDTHFIE